MNILLFSQAVLSLAHDWCRIELGLKVDAVWSWYHLGIRLYCRGKPRTISIKIVCDLNEIPLGAPWEYIDIVTATQFFFVTDCNYTSNPTKHDPPMVIVAGVLLHMRLHPSEIRAHLPPTFQLT